MSLSLLGFGYENDCFEIKVSWSKSLRKCFQLEQLEGFLKLKSSNFARVKVLYCNQTR